MNVQINQQGSDWPFALMLDEVWLRVHRIMVHKLEGAGLWIQAGPYLQLMREQQSHGESLKELILLPILGQVDYAYLNGEAIFGPANYRFRSRIAQVLCFGYELGRGMRTLKKHTPTEEDEQIARLCALFNLGISVFDMVFDFYPELSEGFTEIFNEQTLLKVRHSPELNLMQDIAIDEQLAGESRVLLKIILSFFKSVHTLFKFNQDRALQEELFDLLHAAYQAEVQSVQLNQGSNMTNVVRAKSTLPFAIIHRLVSSHMDDDLIPYVREVDEIMKCIGTLFWLVDDVSDIVRDLQSGSVNSLLLTTYSAWQQTVDPLVNYSVLTELLEENIIIDTVSEIVSNLTQINCILQKITLEGSSTAKLHSVLLAYVRNWLE